MIRLRFAIYARKSTESLERQVMSIEAQVRKAREMFPDVEIVLVIEERCSAFEPGRRPLFEQLLADIDAGKLDGIIAWHPDRLSRNEEEAAKVTYRVRKGVIKDLRFCSYHFVNSPEGIMMLQLALSQSQYFSSKLSNDVKRGMEFKAKSGWRPGVAPIGYLNNVVDHTITEDPERFELVRRMWDRLLSGLYSPPRIGEMAEFEWGLTTAQHKNLGGKPLSASGVYRLFRDPFYAGLVRWSGEIYQGKHTPMLTLAEFKAAQAILDGKPNSALNRSRTLVEHDFPYRGLIKCGECGCQYTAEVQRGHVYYHCTHRKKGYKCSQTKNIREEHVQAAIDRVMAQHSVHVKFRDWALENLQTSTWRDLQTEQQAHASRRARIAQLQGHFDRLLDLKLQGLVGDADFQSKQNALKAEIAELAQQDDRVKEDEDKLDKQLRRVLDLATYGAGVLQYGSTAKKRIIASRIGKSYTALNGRLDIEISDWLVPFFGLATPSSAVRSPKAPHRVEQVRTAEVRNWRSGKGKSAPFLADHSSWLGRLQEVRTRLHEAINDLWLPDFDVLGDIGDH